MLRRIHLSRSIYSHVKPFHLRTSCAATSSFSTRFDPRNDNYTTITTESGPQEQTNTLDDGTRVTQSINPDTGASPGNYNPPTLPLLTSLLPVSPTPSQHDDLESFLSYAHRTGLDPSSTVYRGTLYEYITLLTLQRYGFELVRVGGKGDFGVDLFGYWHLSSADGNRDGKFTVRHCSGVLDRRPPLRVLVQCKRLTGKGKIGPNLVRELEGAFRGAPVGWRGDKVVGLLVGVTAATKGVVQALRRSQRAIGWILLEEQGMENVDGGEQEREVRSDDAQEMRQHESAIGKVRQILWNQKAREAGLEGIDVVKKYDADGKDEIALMYKGEIVTDAVQTDQAREVAGP